MHKYRLRLNNFLKISLAIYFILACSGGTQQRSRGCSGGEIGQTGCAPQIHSTDSRVCNEESCVPPRT